MEVVGVEGSAHIGQIQTGLSDCIKIAQVRRLCYISQLILFTGARGKYFIRQRGRRISSSSRWRTLVTGKRVTKGGGGGMSGACTDLTIIRNPQQ